MENNLGKTIEMFFKKSCHQPVLMCERGSTALQVTCRHLLENVPLQEEGISRFGIMTVCPSKTGKTVLRLIRLLKGLTKYYTVYGIFCNDIL